jgi:hypothetical protein
VLLGKATRQVATWRASHVRTINVYGEGRVMALSCNKGTHRLLVLGRRNCHIPISALVNHFQTGCCMARRARH